MTWPLGVETLSSWAYDEGGKGKKAMLRAICSVTAALLLFGASGWAQSGNYTTQFRVSPPAPTAPNPFSRGTANSSPAPFGKSTPQRFNVSPFPNPNRNLGIFIRNRIVSRQHHAHAGTEPIYIYVPYVPYPNVYLYYPYDTDLHGAVAAPQQSNGLSNQDPPLQAEQARDGSIELASRKSEVTFHSTPAGADIYVDGNFVGNTPSTISLATGLHTIYIQQWGYQAWQRVLTVTAGGKITINAILSEN